METKHTPLPWSKVTTGQIMTEQYNQPFAVTQKGEPNLIAGTFGDVKGGIEVAEANAAFIVRACNSHAKLVKALERLVKINEEHNSAVEKVMGRPAGWNDSYLDAARKALNETKA